MATPTSVKHPAAEDAPSTGTTTRRPNSVVVVALIATLVFAAIVVYAVIRWDNPQNGVTSQAAQPAEAAVVIVPSISLAISPIEEAQRFTPEWYAWYKSLPVAVPGSGLDLIREWATYTDQYWAMAETSPIAFPATSGTAFYTQQYWDMAAARTAVAIETSTAVYGPQGAYYTERYWQMAAPEQSLIAPMAAGVYGINAHDAYYTERYWRMAENNSFAQPEWSYYTEQYWALQDK
ncbi:MAG: hypothetical protein R6X18_04945 [Chloroflexota bacterium]|jgi:hypothetical protein